MRIPCDGGMVVARGLRLEQTAQGLLRPKPVARGIARGDQRLATAQNREKCCAAVAQDRQFPDNAHIPGLGVVVAVEDPSVADSFRGDRV